MAPPTIRAVTEDDVELLAGIERLAFESRWLAGDFKTFLFTSRGMGFVAERGNQLLGYALCEAFDSRLQLVRIAVHPRHWGQRVGWTLLRVLKSGLREDGRLRILSDVAEGNVHAQLFLKACGFRAIGAIEAFFPDGEGAIKMEFRLLPRDTQLDFFCFRRARQR